MLTLIAAIDRNGAIGRAGEIPWHVPEDLRFFNRETTGGAVIMGRKTWESLPLRPLPRRLNLIVGSDPGMCPSVAQALDLARAQSYSRVYGIGGGGIYRELLPIADRLLITHVETITERADAFFPDIDEKMWRVSETYPISDLKLNCVAREYLRR